MQTATIALPDGRTGRLVMPDLYEMVMGVGEIPSPDVAAVLQLLDGTGALPRPNLIAKLKASAEHYGRLYQVAALCLEWPRLVLVRRRCNSCQHAWDDGQKQCPACMSADVVRDDARGPDELGPRDMNFMTVQDIYLNFFLGDAAPIGPAAPPEDADGAAGAARDRDGLRPDAEPVSRDR